MAEVCLWKQRAHALAGAVEILDEDSFDLECVISGLGKSLLPSMPRGRRRHKSDDPAGCYVAVVSLPPAVARRHTVSGLPLGPAQTPARWRGLLPSQPLLSPGRDRMLPRPAPAGRFWCASAGLALGCAGGTPDRAVAKERLNFL
jgi:hypothetical protein